MKTKGIHLRYHKWGNCDRKKSDLVGVLEDLVPTQDLCPTPVIQVVLLDGAAIVNMLRPGFANTFSDYVTQVFLPYITSQLQHVN